MKTRCINPYKQIQFYHQNTAKVCRTQTKPKLYTPKNNVPDIKPSLSDKSDTKHILEMFEQYYRSFCEMEIETFEAIYRCKLSPEQKEKLINQMLKYKR